MRKANLLKKLPLIISIGLFQTSAVIASDAEKFLLGTVNLKQNPELNSYIDPEHNRMVSAVLNSQTSTASKLDWNKSPKELIKEQEYQDAFKKAKKDICLNEETTNSFINWTGNGCDNILANKIDEEKEKERLKNGDEWAKKYIGEKVGNIGKDLGVRYLNNKLNKLLTFQGESKRYYGSGVESVRLPFFLGNLSNPFKDAKSCNISIKDTYEREKEILVINQDIEEYNTTLSGYKNNLSDLEENSDEYEDLQSKITQKEDEINKKQTSLDNKLAQLNKYKIQANANCAVEDDYKTESWLAIGYTDGSLLAYKTDTNPESSLYHQPLVVDAQKCNLTDESTKEYCQIPEDNIRYITAESMLNRAMGDHYSIKSIKTMSAQDSEGNPEYNKINLIVGFGRDTVVSYKAGPGIDLANPKSTTFSLKKTTVAEGGMVTSLMVSSDKNHNFTANLIGNTENSYGVTDMNVIYEKAGNDKVNRYLVIRKEGESKSTDNFDFSVGIQTIGGVPMPLPSVGILPLIGSLFNQTKVTKKIKFDTRKQSDSDIHKIEMPTKVANMFPTVTRDEEKMGVYLGYETGKAYLLHPGTDFTKDVQPDAILDDMKLGAIYGSADFNGTSCSIKDACNTAVNYIYTIPDQNLLIYGSGKDLIYVHYKQTYNSYGNQTLTVDGYGGYYLENHSEFILDGQVGYPVNMFVWEHRIFLVLNTGKVVSSSYDANGKKMEQLVLDDNFEINDPVNSEANKLREKLKSSSETLVAKNGKTAAFISSGSENGINLFSTEDPGLKGEIKTIQLATSISSNTSSDRLSSRGISHQYYKSSHNPWRYNVNHPITNLNFRYDDSDSPSELRFSFGQVGNDKYGSQLHFDGSVYSMLIEDSKFKGTAYPYLLQPDSICKHPDNDHVAEIYCNLNDSGPKFLQNI
ncbi:alpha-helical pore-forming toxin family protein [Francisellaceae bacterium]|nr:alpha-helical pore-forming toxin family protein [Francisellaceae bacterium]